jgi:hypothetical protein
MAAQARQAKVLRIGIIQDGKIVQERLIKANESVTVGESAKNTFVFPKTHLPSAEFAIFKATGKGYVLQFTEKMRGKISSGGAVVALQKLVSDPSVTRKGGVAQLPLTDQDRGKISVDSVTILFQFVAPPPVQAVKAIQAMDFRPRLLDDDDPVFLGFLAIWSALALVLVIWVWNTEPREFTLEDIPDRFAMIIVDEKPPEEIEIEIDEEMDGTAINREVEKKAEGKASDKDPSEAEQVKQQEERKDDLIKASPLLLKILGTTGESTAGVVENLWSDEEQGLGDIDKALQETSGVTMSAADAGLRGGNAGGNDSTDIGDLAGVGGGKGGQVGGLAVKVKPRVTVGSGDVDASGDENAVKGVVTKYSGQLTYCYEKRLKAIPTLGGRIEVGWNVAAGKVSGAPYIVTNTTGDAELASCITQKIRRWEFPSDVDGSLSWPFVFQQKE